ncbi:SDR family NAD(P)-dependent oxidoreductase [Amycolatopsis mediterranei]|uniref:SDR family NAD(P)-dependent oxidoreductase n=1 Tax=Amycolatopsis mediterranei TaxID=33910 RepID=UPI00038DCD71|nr:SDR family NAD(P)-dependent oxidoreductase [Amycolatopsis mediterranei]AGT84436.1 short-chain dehydrogenase [Amycolatopsis mediterranei RB]
MAEDEAAKRPGDGPLAGRVALVTGAGRGLGRAHARTLAAAGAAVVVNDLSVSVDGSAAEDDDLAARTAAAIVADGGQAAADRSDVSDFAGAEAAVRCALDTFGRLDILVNNAGILIGAELAELSQKDIERCLTVNVLGSAGTVRAAFGHMRARRYGRVVNTLSEAGLRTGCHAGVAYAAAKAALWGLTMALSDEAAPHGITVNAVSPGARTRMSQDHLDHAGHGLDLAPEHVSRVVLALVAESAADITGRVVHAAGGEVREYRLSREADTPLVRQLAGKEYV